MSTRYINIIKTSNVTPVILIRLMVGGVFLSEGIQKFLFAEKLGSGRFKTIGLPNPEFLGYFVGSCEIICGFLVLIGLLTRLAVIPLIITMIVAMLTTKAKVLQEEGFWAMLHDSRTDWSMLLGSTFLLWTGGANWSLDNYLWKRHRV